jgi:SAM-dependent methyltransferase
LADQSILNPGNLLMVQERERFLARLFRSVGWTNLETLKAFEAGCSTGYNLRMLVQWGGRPENLAGIDLDPAAVDYCRAHSPEIRVHAGSADTVPEATGTFDLAIAFTLFSSVPDDEVSRAIASELVRITKPGGLIVVYDMRRKNPANKRVHPVSRADIARWFGRCRVRSRTMTPAPPLARAAGKRAPWAYGLLAAVPPVRTHAMWVIRTPAH